MPKTSEPRILLVEDEESLAVGLQFNLQQEGYTVQRAADGREALEHFARENFDLIILDLMLPYVDGYEVAQTIRARSPQLPILMLTARTTAKDRVQGLEAGADDYVIKPFHLRELLLRVKGMLKRKQWYQDESREEPVYRFGDNTIDFASLTAKTRTQEFQLTAREAMVLKYLVEHEGRVVSRTELLENVWQVEGTVKTRTVDAFIARLRKYFEDDPKHPEFITSVREVGYQFVSGR